MHTKNLIYILTVCGLVVLCVAVFIYPTRLGLVIQSSAAMEFHISKTWSDAEIDHTPITISLSATDGKGLRVDVKAPFFNSPPAPNSPAGQPCDRLWDYEGTYTLLLC